MWGTVRGELEFEVKEADSQEEEADSFWTQLSASGCDQRVKQPERKTRATAEAHAAKVALLKLKGDLQQLPRVQREVWSGRALKKALSIANLLEDDKQIALHTDDIRHAKGLGYSEQPETQAGQKVAKAEGSGALLSDSGKVLKREHKSEGLCTDIPHRVTAVDGLTGKQEVRREVKSTREDTTSHPRRLA